MKTEMFDLNGVVVQYKPTVSHSYNVTEAKRTGYGHLRFMQPAEFTENGSMSMPTQEVGRYLSDEAMHEFGELLIQQATAHKLAGALAGKQS